MPNFDPNNLDQNVVNIAKAIRQVESGNKAVLPAEGGGLGGASRYQYTTSTWKGVAQKYLGDANAPLTAKNEDQASYMRIKEWKDAGKTPKQIASMWNAGEGKPDAYKQNVKGVNEYGVKYDVPAYADKVYNEFAKISKANPPKKPTDTTQNVISGPAPLQSPSLYDKAKNVYDKVKNVADTVNNLNPASMALQVGKDTVGGMFNTYKDVIQKIPQDIQAGASDIQKGGALNIAKGVVKGAVRPAADVAEAVFAPIGSFIGAVSKMTGLTDLTEKTAQFIVDKTGIADNPEFQKFAVQHPEAENDFGRLLTLIAAKGEKGDITAKGLADVVKSGADAIKSGGEKVIGTVSDTYKNYQAKQAVKDAQKFDNLANKITQGKTTDIPSAQKALSNVDISDVKTYKDLGETLDAKVETIANKQDQVLSTDKRSIKLDDWSKETKVGNKTVKQNFVSDALNHLEELYQKTNDAVSEAKITKLKEKAQTTGLSIKEVNDLSRQYGTEFGKKAFGKTGDPLTSTNAQNFENTRSGLKDTAREKFGNKLYDASDKEMSNLLNTKKLVDKMEESVNTLKGKVQVRSLGAKAGYLLGKIINFVSLGSAKGFVESLIPRGSGLKVLNALDLEKSLSKNLKLLQEMSNEKLPESQLISKMNEFLVNNMLDTKTPPLLMEGKPGTPIGNINLPERIGDADKSGVSSQTSQSTLPYEIRPGQRALPSPAQTIQRPINLPSEGILRGQQNIR